MDGAASNIAKTALLDESLDGKYAALVGGHAISTESITPATIITADKPLARTIATPAQTEPSDAARRPRSRTSGVEGWAWDGSGGGTGSDGGAHTPVTDLYAGRQRSSTHSNEMRVVSTMTTAVIQNTAIFKSNPRKELPRTLTIVQERASADNDDCDNSDAPEVAGDEPATHGGVQDSLSVTLLAPDATAINSQKLATAEQRTTAVHMRSFTNSGCTTIDGGGRGRRITAGTDYGGIARTAVDKQRQNASQHRRSRFITVDASDPSSIGARCGRHKRSGSIATFLTLPAGVDRAAHMVLRGGATRRFSLDAMRIPSRWWSLRNVIACFNVSVLVLAILVGRRRLFFSRHVANTVDADVYRTVDLLCVLLRVHIL